MKTKLMAWLPVLLMLGLSCKKNDDLPKIAVVTDLNVVNATNDTLNFYLDGTRINNTSNLYPAGVSGYLPVATLGLSAPQNYQFKKPGGTSSLLSVPLALTDSTFNSLFIAGLGAGQNFATKDTLANDTLTVRKATTCYVRFVHTSPASGNLDVYVGDTVKFLNRPFKSVSQFTLLTIGKKTVSVYKTGTSTPIFQETIVLTNSNPSNNYTFFTYGAIGNTTSNPFGLGSMVYQ